jgi:uncharacterized iron-regulated protein
MPPESWDQRFAKAYDSELAQDRSLMGALAQEARAGSAWWQALAQEREQANIALRQEINWLRRQVEALTDRVPVVSEADITVNGRVD